MPGRSFHKLFTNLFRFSDKSAGKSVSTPDMKTLRFAGLTALTLLALSSAALLTADQNITSPADAELKRLQGYWEGEGEGGKCSIAITNSTLFYRAGTSWFQTTFILPKSTDPRQLHATITESSAPKDNSVGTVVTTIFKIEDETLTLVTFHGSEKPSPEAFDNVPGRYTVKKAQPPKENNEPKKANEPPTPRVGENQLDKLVPGLGKEWLEPAKK